MKKFAIKYFALAITLLLLTSCSGGGTSAPSEDAFISGNGSILQISPEKRGVVPTLSGKTLDGTFTQSAGKSRLLMCGQVGAHHVELKPQHFKPCPPLFRMFNS